MVASLGNETAYLIIDCTRAGPKCRTLVIGPAYHGTILPLRWRTVKGKKGHLNLTMTVQWDDQEDEPLCLISTLAIHDAPHCVYVPPPGFQAA